MRGFSLFIPCPLRLQGDYHIWKTSIRKGKNLIEKSNNVLITHNMSIQYRKRQKTLNNKIYEANNVKGVNKAHAINKTYKVRFKTIIQ